ncbi:hypothetical protein JCM8097_007158 [Rhodosporidiobolus ruineniae]
MATPTEVAASSALSLAAIPAADKPSSSKTSLTDEKVVDVESLDDNLIHGHVLKNGVRVAISWTKEEQRRLVRKADLFLLPIFTVLFFWMHLDRTNLGSVLTTTFLKDTGITKDEANTGTSLLWLGVTLLEIPSNIILQRVGAHIWIPAQVVVWGLAEVLHMFVSNPGGFYVARLALGLLESGFIPGALYTIQRWYTQEELVKRTVIFFYGTSIASACGSFIAAGCIKIDGHLGLKSWQWIFLIDGVCTIFCGVLAFLLLPRDARSTAGLLRGKGWFNEREADVFMARIETADPLKEQGATLKITFKDVLSVLGDWRLYPHFLLCLSGLQSVGGLMTWGASIIKGLGFSSIRTFISDPGSSYSAILTAASAGANLLNIPGPILTCLTSFLLAIPLDRYRRGYGFGIAFAALWTLAGLIALYSLPVLQNTHNWGFYAAYVFTSAAPAWQPINVTWVALSMRTPQRRAIAYAAYIGASNLGSTYGSQVFRASDAPRYKKAWAACLSLGAVWLATALIQTSQYWLSNRKKAQRWASITAEEQEEYKQTATEQTGRRLDFQYPF